MSLNAKNLLQQRCQLARTELPSYQSEQDPITKLWCSMVSLDGMISIGQACARKTAAEISAAETMLARLEPDGCHREENTSKDRQFENVISETQHEVLALMYPHPDDKSPHFVLIDYENVNKLDDLHHEFLSIAGYRAPICKFVAYCNPKAETTEPSHVVRAAGADAVDHYISFYLGRLVSWLLSSPFEQDGSLRATIYVVTRDKFAAHYSFIRHSNIQIVHCTSEAQCTKALGEAGYKKGLRIVYQLPSP